MATKKRTEELPTGEAMASLLDVGRALGGAAGPADLPNALQRVLERLERHHGVTQGAVTWLEPAAGEIVIVASIGLSPEGQQARYKLGEGITGRVVQTGKPVVVPQVSREPLFLRRAFGAKAKQSGEHTFIAVPLMSGRKPGGALCVDLEFRDGRDLEATQRFFSVVASMISQALALRQAVEDERQRLVEENTTLRQELRERYDFSNIIGTAGPMRQVYEQISQVARTQTTVLIRGESGTGKELIAHAIHYNSTRSRRPFVKVSCAALPDTLIESELFGYEKGAFTGAYARKQGRFDVAEGGTLFLDEVGDINLATQVKLLRVLQEREFERVGGTQTQKANVRLIAATNKDLETAISEKAFREDLYYRLNVFTIYVPPLRERKADVLLLADHFLAKYARQHGKPIKRISTPAIDMLMSYHWPGNVRELENTIERAVLVADGSVLHAHHLPPSLQTAESSGTVNSTSLEDAVYKLEKDLIQDALKTASGNAAKAARLLQTTERILHYKIGKYELDPRRFRR
jgi:Nif-specific regulatory protein